MLRGLYAANTSMIYCTNRLDAVSNNLSNSGTYGFKKDTVYGESFNDRLILKVNGSDTPGQPTRRGTTSNRHDDGQLEVMTNSGYFRVMTQNGISNNRNMRFGVDEKGFVSTVDYTSDGKVDTNFGNRVLDSSGKLINVGIGTNANALTVNETGKLLVRGQVRADLLYKPPFNGIGTLNAGVFTKRNVTDYSQGELQQTGSNTDFALADKGFFVVKTPIGEAYTRNGAFKIDRDMYMVTNEGFRVQGIKGDIKLDNAEFSINKFGEIISNGQTVDKIKTTDFENKGDLEKVGATYFALKEIKGDQRPGVNFGKQIPYKGEVIQSMIERSNVESATELVKMITLYREFESGQKLIQAYDNTLAKAASEIGRG